MTPTIDYLSRTLVLLRLSIRMDLSVVKIKITLSHAHLLCVSSRACSSAIFDSTFCNSEDIETSLIYNAYLSALIM